MAEESNKEREAALRKAYSTATNDLREQHRSDFNAFYTARAKELGFDWEPKKTPEERAADEISRLLSEFPDIADRLGITP